MTGTDVDRLDRRLDELEEQVRALAQFGASDVRVAELEHRLEQSAGRIRTLEEQVAHLDRARPARR